MNMFNEDKNNEILKFMGWELFPQAIVTLNVIYGVPYTGTACIWVQDPTDSFRENKIYKSSDVTIPLCDIGKAVHWVAYADKPGFFKEKDWNWAMEVIQKIETLPSTAIIGGLCFIDIRNDGVIVYGENSDQIKPFMVQPGTDKLYCVYQAILYFCTLYNQKSNESLNLTTSSSSNPF